MSETANTAAAPTLPDFAPGVAYDVLMARPVEFPAGSGNWLRPDHRVTMDGAAAAMLKDNISDASLAASTGQPIPL